MSEQDARQFIRKMEDETAFRNQVQAAWSLDDVLAVAAAAQLRVTEQDLATFCPELYEQFAAQLDEATLDSVAGGLSGPIPPPDLPPL